MNNNKLKIVEGSNVKDNAQEAITKLESLESFQKWTSEEVSKLLSRRVSDIEVCLTAIHLAGVDDDILKRVLDILKTGRMTGKGLRGQDFLRWGHTRRAAATELGENSTETFA